MGPTQLIVLIIIKVLNKTTKVIKDKITFHNFKKIINLAKNPKKKFKKNKSIV